MATTTVYPNGDGSRTGTWTPSTGSTYYNLIDEAVADDADYISTSSENAIIYFDFQNMPVDFGTATAVDIHIRTKTGSKGDYLLWNHVQLVSNDEATSITNTAAMSNGHFTFTDFTHSPSIIGSTTKTTWDGIRLKVATASGTTSSCQLSQAYLVVTYTAASGNTYNETGTGGALVGSSATLSKVIHLVGTNGALIGSSAILSRIINVTGTGGGSVGGAGIDGQITPGVGTGFIDTLEFLKASSLQIGGLRREFVTRQKLVNQTPIYYDRINPLNRI